MLCQHMYWPLNSILASVTKNTYLTTGSMAPFGMFCDCFFAGTNLIGAVYNRNMKKKQLQLIIDFRMQVMSLASMMQKLYPTMLFSAFMCSL
jgi:hypothetical protein